MIAVQVLLAFSFSLMAYLTITDRLRRNRFFGIRTPRTLATDGDWLRVHRAFVPFAFAIAAIAVVGLVPLVLTAASGMGFFIALMVVDGLVVALAIIGTVIASRSRA